LSSEWKKMGNIELSDLPQDMTKAEKDVVQSYITNGCPGLMKIQQGDAYKTFELYMSGKTYQEIAAITKISKDLVLYLAYRSKWMEHRFKHYENISLSILDKVRQVKLDAADNLTTIIAAHGKYLAQRYNQFLATNDASIMEGTDNKIVSQYYKSIELLETITTAEEIAEENKKPKQPLVNINVGMGASASINQTGHETIDITQQTSGDLLKALAEMKKTSEVK
jgi:hypothetical protein